MYRYLDSRTNNPAILGIQEAKLSGHLLGILLSLSYRGIKRRGKGWTADIERLQAHAAARALNLNCVVVRHRLRPR